ncbi:MAG: ABC transporter transmembrane domain-containing protein, partial [Pseudomonadota bacterium]
FLMQSARNAALERLAALKAKAEAVSPTPVARHLEALQQAFSPAEDPTQANAADTANGTPWEACLRRFLAVTDWQGEERQIFEALPHFDDVEDVEALQSVLFRLNFQSVVEPTGTGKLRPDFLPCFLQDQSGTAYLIEAIEPETGTLTAFNGTNGQPETLTENALDGILVFPESFDREAFAEDTRKFGWIRIAFGRFKPLLIRIFAISFAVNLLALFVPIYVMNVYDKAIGAKSLDVLRDFTVGILIVIAADLSLRIVRGRAQAYLGARLDTIIGNAGFQQLLHMPVAMTESAPVGAQITRLKQFESIRDAFTGPLASAVVDLPFVVVFVTAVALIGGTLAFIPIGLVLAYGILALITIPLMKRLVSHSGDKKTKLQNLVVEALSGQRTIRDLSATNIWVDRYRTLSAEFAQSNLKTRQFNFLVQTIAQMFMTVSGVATLSLGVFWVLEGTLSPGALIAVMALVWRVLSPIQAAFLSLSKLGQTLQSFQQINSLMRLRLEREPGRLPSMYRSFSGQLTIERVGFRYPTRQEPALRGLEFSIKPGEFVAVAGHSGAGKTTLLKIILGLYPPQAGAVLADGLDVRQLDPGEWRHAIGYQPESAHFFFGTLAQNLRLADPSASDRRLEQVIGQLGFDDYQHLLPDGLETRLSAQRLNSWPDALKQRILLARAFVKDVPIYLLDNPGNNLDFAGDRALLAMIDRMRGDKTIIMTTHRPSHMRAADRLIFMEMGTVAEDGRPEDVIESVFPAA